MFDGVKRYKKLLFILFLVFVPLWAILYVFAYIFFTSDYCNKTWPHDYIKNHCVHYGSKVFQILEFNPIIMLYTYDKIMKNDLLNQKYVNQVYEILAFIDFVFSKYNMKYSIEFGTEMGSIRNGGFIPWDDDVDIVIFEDEEKVAKAFEKEIKEQKQEDRFIFLRGKDNKYLINKWPTIRIKDGIVVDMFNRYIKCKINNRERYFLSKDNTCKGVVFDRLNFNYDEIYPLKKCNFGPLKLSCKNNIKRAFNVYYGNDWRRLLYTKNHTLNRVRNKKIKITKELSKPALPTDYAWKKWVNKKNSLFISKLY